jgi:hypothetical protein
LRRLLGLAGLILLAAVIGLALAYALSSFVRARRGGMLTMDQAVEAARQYVATYRNSDLALAEVMEFEDNFYVKVEEQSTGIHAFELLVDRYTGGVYPEPGPNMMWNSKYGHMGGMMGSWRGGDTGVMPVNSEQARVLAQQWLERFIPGSSAVDETDAFYGYYTIHVMKDGQVFGMLSVNGYSGEVWYHNWHGAFIEMEELEKDNEQS